MNKQQKQAFEVLSKRIVDEADVARLDAFLQGKDIKDSTSNPCMNADFVSFSLAKKLKEKGFKQKCLAYYDVEDNVGLLYNTQYSDEALPCQYTDLLQCHNTGEAETQPDDSGFCVDAPTISQVLKWLREEHLFHVKIGCFNPNRWHYYIQTVMDTYYYDNCRKSFDSYEEAALAGIEYVINNLI